MLIDLVNEALSVNALAPQNLTASTQGAYQDFSSAKIATAAVIDVGAYSAGNTNLQVQIEESTSTSGPWTVINGNGFSSVNGVAQTSAAVTQMVVSGITTSAQHIVIKGLRQHRYVRANAVSVQGTTPSVYCSVEVIAEKQYVGSGGGYSRSPSS